MIYLIYWGIVALVVGTDLIYADYGLAGNIVRGIGYPLIFCGIMALNERLKK